MNESAITEWVISPTGAQAAAIPPTYGTLIGSPFLERFRFDASDAGHFYDGHFIVIYTGTKKHKPVARILSTDSERTQFLTIQQPPGQTIVALNRNGRNRSSGPWYEASLPIKAATYSITGLAEHNNGGAGRDNGLLLTSLVYFNGLHLKLECDDCGGGSPPDFDFNDKVVEVFFPLVYGTDFSQVILTPALYRNMPTKITIA